MKERVMILSERLLVEVIFAMMVEMQMGDNGDDDCEWNNDDEGKDSCEKQKKLR